MDDQKTNGPDDYRLLALNADGILFQERVRSILEKSGLSFHAAEFGVDTGQPNVGGVHRESRLDLWFRYTSREGWIFDILIECKKANPNLKEWVFFKTRDIAELYRCDAVHRKDGSAWSQIRLNTQFHTYYAFLGKELKGVWKNKGHEKEAWKTSTERIDAACDQISIATKSISDRLGNNRDPMETSTGSPHFIVPVIVTSALLFGCNQTDEFHESSENEIQPQEITFSRLDTLVVKYALSSHLQPNLFAYQAELSRDYVEAVGYRDILVCNPLTAFEEIKRLCAAIAKAYRPNA